LIHLLADFDFLGYMSKYLLNVPSCNKMLQIQPEHTKMGPQIQVAFTQRFVGDRLLLASKSCSRSLVTLLRPHDWVRDLVAGIGLRKSNRSDPLTHNSAADYLRAICATFCFMLASISTSAIILMTVRRLLIYCMGCSPMCMLSLGLLAGRS
jgi:hypothetical protein